MFTIRDLSPNVSLEILVASFNSNLPLVMYTLQYLLINPMLLIPICFLPYNIIFAMSKNYSWGGKSANGDTPHSAPKWEGLQKAL